MTWHKPQSWEVQEPIFQFFWLENTFPLLPALRWLWWVTRRLGNHSKRREERWSKVDSGRLRSLFEYQQSLPKRIKLKRSAHVLGARNSNRGGKPNSSIMLHFPRPQKSNTKWQNRIPQCPRVGNILNSLELCLGHGTLQNSAVETTPKETKNSHQWPQQQRQTTSHAWVYTSVSWPAGFF